MARQIGIDLGTSYTTVILRERILMRAPTVVCIDRATHEVICSGSGAKKMLGKTPREILAFRPLKDGVITDREVASLMLRDFFHKLELISVFNRPQVLLSVPYGVTEVERRAVMEATYEAGGRDVRLIDQPIAAAIGAGIPVTKARGVMLVDLGGGVSEASVISLGGVVHAGALRIAGDRLDVAIVDHLKQTRNILIGEITAELLKKRLGSALPTLDRGSMTVCGRDLRTGLAAKAEISSAEVREAIREPLSEIVRMVRQTLEETPPELSADIFDRGIVLTGGVAMLPGIEQLFRTGTGVRATIAKQPAKCTGLGMGQMLRRADGDLSKFVRQ